MSPRVVPVRNFKSWLVLHEKRDKIILAIYRLSQKTRLFANDSKYRNITYRLKSFFSMNIDSRSLHQNKAPFGSDQLSKFRHFCTQKWPDDRNIFCCPSWRSNCAEHNGTKDRYQKRHWLMFELHHHSGPGLNASTRVYRWSSGKPDHG